jgi:hypothetical protein
MQVENATAQLKDAGSANEELQEELTLSKEEVERLIRYLWPTSTQPRLCLPSAVSHHSDRESLVEELAKILQPEQAQLINRTLSVLVASASSHRCSPSHARTRHDTTRSG